MWTAESRGRHDRCKLRYPSDLTDKEWALAAPVILLAKRGGNTRTVDVREVVNGLMYILRPGFQNSLASFPATRDCVAWTGSRAWNTCSYRLLRQTDVLRASKFEHLVQGADSEGDLRSASSIRARAQPVPDHALEPADVGLDQSAPVIA